MLPAYTERNYRHHSGRRAPSRFTVAIGESDLDVQCETASRTTACESLAALRWELERYIARHPRYLTSLVPLDVEAGAPEIVRAMADAARAWDVGPMAAVAGAVSERVGKAIASPGERIVVENGGDIWARADEPLLFAVYAGERSPFGDRLAFSLDASDGVGVCTSSGVVGPSLSLGRADAVVAVARSAAVADAAATAVANRIKAPGDVRSAVEWARARAGLAGLIACCGASLGLFGALELAPVKGEGTCISNA
jgi:uncharacterized protein